MTETFRSPRLTIDHLHALRSAASRLQDEFEGVFSEETIERFLHSTYDQFASRARLPHFLPLLAERFARQRLHALARVEGHHNDGRPTVLFLCVHNAGRSQMDGVLPAPRRRRRGGLVRRLRTREHG